jgi:rhodanese-related sulfurtransferase
MKKQTSLWLAIMLGAALLTGCATVPVFNVSAPPASLEQTVDLSRYQVKAEKPMENHVPIDPQLDYVDTGYLMALMKRESPTSITRVSYSQYPSEWSFVLVDSRPAARYHEGHINGAINIPEGEFEQFIHLLPTEKDKPLIFYCGGLDCPLSAGSAKKAKELGYTKVYVYQEGTPFWKAAGNYLVTTPTHVGSLIMNEHINNVKVKPVVIIDARPYLSYFAAYIPNAVHMDEDIFVEKYLRVMPTDKSTEIITYCGGFFCGKSHNIAALLVNRGYTNVKVLAGGIPAWKEAKLPLFGTDSSGGKFDITDGKVNRKLSPAEFTQRLKSGGKVAVLDIRNDSEVAVGMIKGAIHIPSGQINADPKAIAINLPSDKSTIILIHCASGARAAGVVEKIAGLGYSNTFYLDNRIIIDSNGNFSF